METFEKVSLCGDEPAGSDVLVNAKCFVHPELKEMIAKIEKLCHQFILLIRGSKKNSNKYYTVHWLKHGDSLTKKFTS
jgi:hypothetical protein